MDKNLFRVPAIFQKLDEFRVKDTRFIEVKIWLMHLGKNLNGSKFDEEPVVDAIPSLANTPILLYLEENSMGEIDASDHRMRIVVEDGDYRMKYIGQAVGVIPETNHVQFENRVGDDGVERTYLTTRGLIWTKWEEPVEIFERDKIKSNSMELDESYYEGEYDEDGFFNWKKFRFFGACILGEDFRAAMISSTIEVQNFSMDDFNNEIQEKMEVYKAMKGGPNVDKKNELLIEYNVKLEDLGDFDFESATEDELRNKLIEFTTQTETETETEAETETETFTETETVTETETETETETDQAATEESVDYEAKIEEMQQAHDALLTQHTELESNFNALKDDFNEVNKKYDDAIEALSIYVKREREESETALFEKFEKDLGGVDEFTALKDDCAKFTLDEIEEKLFSILGRKTAKFSAPKKQDPVVQYSFDLEGDDSKLSPLERTISKYLKK